MARSKKKTSAEDPKVEDIKEEERLAPPAPQEEDEPRLESSSAEPPTVAEDTDYLRQYQYRKGAAFGSKESDPVQGSKAERQKKFYLSSPKIRFMIPREFGEDNKIKKTVNENGYRLDFPKNTYIEIPEPVAQVLMKSLDQTEQALQYQRIDTDGTHSKAEKEQALS